MLEGMKNKIHLYISRFKMQSIARVNLHTIFEEGATVAKRKDEGISGEDGKEFVCYDITHCFAEKNRYGKNTEILLNTSSFVTMSF